ncbi:DUF2530 domain-containing protein [Agromyces sp. SYSU K20354]|uniref:DUF2530 domain-containing protein n=1 Tax=Agromyces cavernae TaxID=2898659 RepID=UPI001E4E7C60|nr:DUF2530 domain-containing protein [Agromyces cavernae]MCD2444279.1 DUF2530 domain-containing protein [Agromyces cavernae]
MRFWLSEQERRPDPAPARADARKAVAVGTAAWLVALVASLLFQSQLEAAGYGWFAIAAAVGVGLGLVGLLVVQVIRRRARQAEGSSD